MGLSVHVLCRELEIPNSLFYFGSRKKREEGRP